MSRLTNEVMVSLNRIDCDVMKVETQTVREKWQRRQRPRVHQRHSKELRKREAFRVFAEAMETNGLKVLTYQQLMNRFSMH